MLNFVMLTGASSNNQIIKTKTKNENRCQDRGPGLIQNGCGMGACFVRPRSDGRTVGRTVGRSVGRTVGRSDGRMVGRTGDRTVMIYIFYCMGDGFSSLVNINSIFFTFSNNGYKIEVAILLTRCEEGRHVNAVCHTTMYHTVSLLVSHSAV